MTGRLRLDECAHTLEMSDIAAESRGGKQSRLISIMLSYHDATRAPMSANGSSVRYYYEEVKGKVTWVRQTTDRLRVSRCSVPVCV